MSLGSNGVDRVHSLWKIQTRLRGMNFCIICTNSAHFAPSFMQQPNGPKCTQILRNATKDEFGVQWGWIGCVHCENIWRDFVARTFALIAPVQSILHRVSCSYETIPNAPKHYERHQNMILGSNGMDQVRLLGKIKMWLRGTNLCINCTSSVCFAPCFMQLRNDPKGTKYYKTYWNMTLGSNGVDRVRPLRKIPMWLRGKIFCFNCTN